MVVSVANVRAEARPPRGLGVEANEDTVCRADEERAIFVLRQIDDEETSRSNLPLNAGCVSHIASNVAPGQATVVRAEDLLCPFVVRDGLPPSDGHAI